MNHPNRIFFIWSLVSQTSRITFWQNIPSASCYLDSFFADVAPSKLQISWFDIEEHAIYRHGYFNTWTKSGGHFLIPR